MLQDWGERDGGSADATRAYVNGTEYQPPVAVEDVVVGIGATLVVLANGWILLTQWI